MPLSRRTVVSGAAVAALCGVAPPAWGRSGAGGVADQGPSFTREGPDADRYGLKEGYPVPERALAVREGNPWPARYRVGAFSHLDQIYTTRTVAAGPAAWAFRRPASDARHAPEGVAPVPADYLARNPVTGLLLARDGVILHEAYQYARGDGDRLVAQSMTKSLIGLLVGLALADGALRSVDDTADFYVPGLKGSEYGRTPLRHLLQMSSGVDFGEERDNGRDLERLWRDMVLGQGSRGTVASIRRFDARAAPSGTRYRYASIEPDVLALVLRQAVGRPLSTYLQDRLWQPLGAEADATWMVDAEGLELGHFGFSATLRDYARLGRLLACDGARDGKQLIPAQWLRDATTVSADSHLAPGRAMRNFGYGYLLWLLPGPGRQFALVGQNGQRICVDPQSRLVLVQTALEQTDEFWRLWRALVQQLR